MKLILKGGKILNRGFKGVVMEMYNNDVNDNKTLYNELMMNIKDISELSLITINGRIKIDEKDFNLILKLIKKRSKKVLVKKFDSSSFMFGSNEKNFNNEFEGYKQLIAIFKKDVSKYTTVKKGFTYKKQDIYGLVYKKNYYIFLEKCYNTLENIKFTNKLLNKCTKEILEILNILNANNYIHNDIKPDNIILCRKRFKIIDWESSNYIKDQASTFINTKNGNLLFNHPIKFYRIGVPYTFYKYIYDNEFFTYRYLTNLKSPKKISNMVESSYNQVVIKYSKLSKIIPEEKNEKIKRKIEQQKITDIKEDKNYYLKLSDYYAFALTIIYMAEKNKIDYPHKIIDNILNYYFMKMI